MQKFWVYLSNGIAFAHTGNSESEVRAYAEQVVRCDYFSRCEISKICAES